MKLLLGITILFCTVLYTVTDHYARKLYNRLDSLRAIKKLETLTWVIIALDSILIICITYIIRFSVFNFKAMLIAAIASNIIFICILFQWIRFLQELKSASKSPQKIFCNHYLGLHRKYMEAGQPDQAEAAAKKALEYNSHRYEVWLQLANNYIYMQPNSERIVQYLETAREIINKNGDKNGELAAYKMSLAYLSVKKEKLVEAVEYSKQSLDLHYSRKNKRLLKNLEKYLKSQSE